jgi:hypothetical protein
MKEQLLSFETAKLAEEKGVDLYSEDYYIISTGKFETSLSGVYNNKTIVKAYTQSLLQKWLRDKHKIEVLVYCNASGWMWELNKAMNIDWFSGGTFIKFSEYSGPNNSGEWNTYEEALEQGLVEALKLI